MSRFMKLLLPAFVLAGVLAPALNAADVSGRIAIPADTDVKLKMKKAVITLSKAVSREPLPFPEGFKEMTTPEKRAWYTKWKSTEEGKAYNKRMKDAYDARTVYTIKADAEGNFSQKDVEAGTYTLMIKFFKKKNPTRSTDPIADGGKRLTVADQPVDAGEIPVTIRHTVDVGEVAPDFNVKTVDGQPLKLSDHRGKYVLVDFWAVWCGPCIAETPNLKDTYAAFESNPRFAMIGLSLDKETAAPIGYAKKNDLGWIQGYLGDWSKDQVTKQYGVRGIPSIWLIGPDGKVVAKGLRGEKIQEAVAEHMKTLPN